MDMEDFVTVGEPACIENCLSSSTPEIPSACVPRSCVCSVLLLYLEQPLPPPLLTTHSVSLNYFCRTASSRGRRMGNSGAWWLTLDWQQRLNSEGKSGQAIHGPWVN